MLLYCICFICDLYYLCDVFLCCALPRGGSRQSQCLLCESLARESAARTGGLGGRKGGERHPCIPGNSIIQLATQHSASLARCPSLAFVPSHPASWLHLPEDLSAFSGPRRAPGEDNVSSEQVRRHSPSSPSLSSHPLYSLRESLSVIVRLR